MRADFARFACGLLIAVMLHAGLLLGVQMAIRAAAGAKKPPAVDVPPELEIADMEFSSAEEDVEEAVDRVVTTVSAPEERPVPPLPSPREFEPPPLLQPRESPISIEKREIEIREMDLRPKDLEAPETPKEDYPVVETSAVEKPPTEKPVEKEVAAVPVSSQEISAPLAPAPRQARVDAPPAPRKKIRPQYPKGARERKEQGDVTLELSVDAHGVVIGVKVVASCGFAELEQAALAAARRALFRPARRGSESVPSIARLTLTFKLRD